MLRCSVVIFAFWVALHCPGCGGDTAGDGPDATEDGSIGVLEISATFDWPEAPEGVVSTAEADIYTLAVGGGRVMVGTEAGVFRIHTEGLESLLPYPTQVGDPLYTGAVQAFTAVAEEILVAATGGIFHSSGEVLLRSPLSDVLEGAVITNFDVADDDDSVWLATSDGFLRVAEDVLESISIEGAEGEPGFVVAVDEVVLVTYGTDIYEVERTVWTATKVGFAAPIHGAVSWGQRAAFATDSGLLLRENDGAYLNYTLSHTGARPVLALDGSDATRLVMATDTGVVTLSDHGGELMLSALFGGAELPNVSALTVGPLGHVWTASGAELIKWPLGDVTSFAEVLPYFESSCNWCHGTGLDGAPKRDFSNYDVVVSMVEPMMERIVLGLMPPSKYDDAITDDELNLLTSWIDGGLTP